MGFEGTVVEQARSFIHAHVPDGLHQAENHLGNLEASHRQPHVALHIPSSVSYG